MFIILIPIIFQLLSTYFSINIFLIYIFLQILFT